MKSRHAVWPAGQGSRDFIPAYMLDGTSVFEIKHVLTDKEEIIIGPKNSCGWPLAICRGFRPPWDVIVTWADESGEPGEYKTTLTF
jgi:hypothetical protein